MYILLKGNCGQVDWVQQASTSRAVSAEHQMGPASLRPVDLALQATTSRPVDLAHQATTSRPVSVQSQMRPASRPVDRIQQASTSGAVPATNADRVRHTPNVITTSQGGASTRNTRSPSVSSFNEGK